MMNSECHAKKCALDLEINKELLKDFNQINNVNGFASLEDHTPSSCDVKNEPRKKRLKAQREAEGYYSNSGKMTVPGRLSINVSCINQQF